MGFFANVYEVLMAAGMFKANNEICASQEVKYRSRKENFIEIKK